MKRWLTHSDTIHFWLVHVWVVMVESLPSEGDARAYRWKKFLVAQICWEDLVDVVHRWDDCCKIWSWAQEVQCCVLKDLIMFVCIINPANRCNILLTLRTLWSCPTITHSSSVSSRSCKPSSHHCVTRSIALWCFTAYSSKSSIEFHWVAMSLGIKVMVIRRSLNISFHAGSAIVEKLTIL